MNAELRNCPSLVDVVRLRALQTPQQVSCIFVDKDHEEKMTYAELDQQARAIAAQLQARKVQPGARILLLFAPGLPLIQAFIGCLYAGCVAVPIYPPAQEKLRDKALRIIANAKPVVALMTASHLSAFTTTTQQGISYLGNVPCFAVETIEPALSAHWQAPRLTKQDVAFLQYTSGSTMHPKGVMISHQNLIDNADKMYTTYEMNEETILFSWLPPHHDMGLIGAILTPIYGGIPSITMSPFAFLENPVSWLQNISKYQATISGSPNFAYDYCVKRIKEEKKQGLDLSSWLIAANGAEPIRKETLEHFYQAFKDYGFKHEAFFPCYGLAEATLLVTCNTPGKQYRTLTLAKEEYQDHRVHFAEENSPGSHNLVSCGRLRQTVKIVDPDSLTLCANDQVGEIWVHSDSVAQGYWHQEEETAHAFHGKINGETAAQVYLRTGDLGFIHDEELYVTGRIKDLIILYGKNHYPQDIEYSIQHAPIQSKLGKCAAFVIQMDHEYQLTVVCEVKDALLSPTEQETLFNDIFAAIYKAHQLEVHRIVLIPPREMPYTTSGKIRRNFCRNALLDHSLPLVASWQLHQAKE